MPSKLKKAIAAVKDQTSIGLAKVSGDVSSNLEVAVLKATSHDAVPVEEKYVSEVVYLVSSNKVHAAACARAIGKRIGRTRNWVVALKSLMLVLRIFQDGDPYFPREVLHAMKRGAKILNLSSFRDDSNSSPWDFTSFVRTFALYLDERLECFLTGKLQRRNKHEGSTSSYQRSRSLRANDPVRDMKPAMLLDKMSYWQRLLDRAIATRPTGAAKSNRLVQIALYAIVLETFDLYKDISDGLSLILDSFFHLQYQNCVSAFQTCIKAVKQFDELSAFFTLCKSLGVGRSSEYPSVQAISEELIESLQEFLKDQSSFASAVKPPAQLFTAPPIQVRPRSTRHDSCGGLSDYSPTTDAFSDRTSEIGSQCASLEDLISATELWKGPSRALSIDLEAYSSTKRDDAFGISDTASSRSLPVSSPAADLMSLDDWSTDEEQEQQQDQQQEKQKEILDSSASKNWETMLAETISSSSSSPQTVSQLFTDNNTNTFNAFPEIISSPPPGFSQAPTDINTNTFNALPEQPSAEKTPSTATKTSTDAWDLVLFEAARSPQPTPDIQTPPHHHYNPFLQDLIELAGASNQKSAKKTPTFQAGASNQQYALTAPTFQADQQSALTAPTFQASPTFSAQSPNLNVREDDPFGSSEQMFSSSIDQQNLQQQQLLWLQNQSKIIAKYLT